MNYLILASSFNRFAGPNNPLLDLCNYLYEKLHVHLRLLTHNSNFDIGFMQCVKFPMLPMLIGQPSNPFVRLACAPVNIRIIRNFLKHYKVHPTNLFVNASIDTLFETYYAASGLKVNTGYNVLFSRPHSLPFNVLDHLAAKHIVRKILAHTYYQKALYNKIGIKKESIVVIPHCINSARIERIANQYNTDSPQDTIGKIIIFYGGRLSAEKGIKELMECCRFLSNEIPLNLVLVGDGPLRGWVLRKKDQIERHSKSFSVNLVAGWQPPKILLSKMLQADVVVLPSYHEMFPIILLEAMCLRKAVVSTCFGGPKEMIIPRTNGLLVDPHNQNELKAALLELSTDTKLRQHLGRNAYQVLREKYDVSVVGPKFLAFLENN